MRERDFDEIIALRDHNSREMLAYEAHAYIINKGRGKVSWYKGKPAAFAAFTEMHPGVFEVWMAGTDDFKPAAMPLLKWFRNEANQILSAVSGHRLQCDSRSDYEEAHKLIRGMGGIPEGPPMRKYGKGGEDYQRFVWLNGENDSVLSAGHTTRVA